MRHFLAVSAVLVPVAFIACGGGGSGGSGGSGASTGTNTSTTTTSTSSATDTGSTSTTTTTTPSGPTDACKNAGDGALVAANDMAGISSSCALSNLLQEPATLNCIQALGGDAGAKLSADCAGCFDGAVMCAAAPTKCGPKCSPLSGGDPKSQACADCRAQQCDPAFYTCSGLPKPGKCTNNTTDPPLLAANDLPTIAGACAMATTMQEPAMLNCIQALGGDAGAKLTADCAGCFDAAVGCAATKCTADCLPPGGDPTGAACTACRKTNCDPAFADCSGITP